MNAVHMSAFGGKADMGLMHCCPLVTQSGHSAIRPLSAWASTALVHESHRFWTTHVAGPDTVQMEASTFDQHLDRAVEMATASYAFPDRS